MPKIYCTKQGRWGVDITIDKRRHRRVIGTKQEAKAVLNDMLEARKIGLKFQKNPTPFPTLFPPLSS